MNDLVNTINGFVWSPVLVYLCLGAGLYFSIRSRFVQLRGLPEMFRLLLRGRSSSMGVSPFQALSMALSNRVGTGNIAGVATAITFGGPGAVFWMWMVAFFGASTAFVESTLAQIYKERDHDGRYRGGPAYYIEKALGQRWYAYVFAVATMIGTGIFLCGIQANTIVASVGNAWPVPAWVTAGGVVGLLALVIFGGVRRIARFAAIVVPFMALAYIGVALVLMVLNAAEIPAMFALIVRSAFNMEAAYGAIAGLSVEWGVKRGVLSNEAGMGSGAHHAGAAEVDHPAQQGFVQAFSIYIDTLLVCTATAFMLLLTGAYNIVGPDGTSIVENLPGVETGPAFAQAAIESLLPGLGARFVAVALFMFAFTTIVACYYVSETSLAYLTRDKPRAWLMQGWRALVLVGVGYCALNPAPLAWSLADLAVGVMSWLNIVAILIVHKPAFLALRDYDAKRHSGQTIDFDPESLGIAKADLWAKKFRERAVDG
jgi:AGCS family alanine or glycine:cation symporter